MACRLDSSTLLVLVTTPCRVMVSFAVRVGRLGVIAVNRIDTQD